MADSAYNAVETRDVADLRRDRPHSNARDHHRDNDREGSDTEVDESLISDDEKQWETIVLEREAHRRRHRLAALSPVGRALAAARRHRWAIDTGLLVVILGLVLYLQVAIRQRPSTSAAEPATSAKWQVGGDYTGQGPIFDTKVVKWEADEAFVPAKDADFASNTTLATWNTLMPQGTGWKHTEAQKTFFTTTMTHQLHCILMMGRIYTALRLGQMPSPDLPADYHSHYLHCIDYLRQATMCAGDVSMEAHEPNDSSDNGPLDGGWSGHHVCKDYGQIKSYLESQIRDGVRTVLPIDD